MPDPPIITPSQSTSALSSQSGSVTGTSISYEEENTANSNKRRKRWLPWRMNWFKKRSPRTLDDDGLGSVSTFSSNRPSSPSITDKSPGQVASPAPPITEEEEVVLDTSSRLTSLRELMTTDQLNFYVVPSQDNHISEFVAPKDRRLKWISGFTGSSGLAVITHNEAVLFTDSRYWAQASKQLDSNWKLQRVGLDGGEDWLDYIQRQSRDSRIGADPRHIPHKTAIDLRERLRLTNSKLIFPENNLIDAVWRGRPHRSKEIIFIHPVQFSGVSAGDKINTIKDWIRQQSPILKKEEKKPNVLLLASLSEIAWTLNLRGNDIPFTPVFYSYLLIALDSTTLFVERAKLTDDVAEYLSKLGVMIEDYDNFWNFLRNKKWGEGKILMSENTPYVVSLLIGSSWYIIIPSIVEELKAAKNETELRGLEQAYVRDGAVFVRWLAWLEERLRKGSTSTMTEYEAAMRLNEFQKQGENFVGPAYETRSAYGPNAALPFYTPRRSGGSMIDRRKPYLIDSGCQFLDGTCSTTRTLHFGSPANEQRDAFTRVLQGHIAIDSAIFPEGATGGQLDVLAKRELWAGGLNYLQPTGSGIGSFLSAHEGPQALATGNNVPLKPGHVLINQPGFYREDDFGIRIGSALVVARIKASFTLDNSLEGGSWLGFRRLTRVPIQTRMVQFGLLSEKEKFWIKEHNLNCFKVLAPLLKDDKRALIWLREQLDPNLAREIGPERR